MNIKLFVFSQNQRLGTPFPLLLDVREIGITPNACRRDDATGKIFWTIVEMDIDESFYRERPVSQSLGAFVYFSVCLLTAAMRCVCRRTRISPTGEA